MRYSTFNLKIKKNVINYDAFMIEMKPEELITETKLVKNEKKSINSRTYVCKHYYTYYSLILYLLNIYP